MKIYLVKGYDGEYDDFHEWNIMAFTSMVRAEHHVFVKRQEQNCLNEFAKRINATMKKWAERNQPKFTTYSEYVTAHDQHREKYIKKIAPDLDQDTIDTMNCLPHVSITNHKFIVEELELN